LAYYSEGAFNQDIVYNLPVYLRTFYLRKLIEVKEKEQAQIEKSSDKSSPKIARPPV
jgi:hypothetical protein